MHISIYTKRSFSGLWLKYVSGFNPKIRCFRCLLGQPALGLARSNTDARKAQHLTEGDLEDGWPYVYLCALRPGSAKGRVGDLHLAFKPVPGHPPIHIDNAWIEVTVSDAEEVPIRDIPPGECDLGEKYTTCMNYKFGWWYLKDKDLRKA